MKLDRNLPNDQKKGRRDTGKYALLLIRNLPDDAESDEGRSVYQAIETLDRAGLLDWGVTKTKREFFPIRLRDRNALPALMAYVGSVLGTSGDAEYANDVLELAMRSGGLSPWCKDPD